MVARKEGDVNKNSTKVQVGVWLLIDSLVYNNIIDVVVENFYYLNYTSKGDKSYTDEQHHSSWHRHLPD